MNKKILALPLAAMCITYFASPGIPADLNSSENTALHPRLLATQMTGEVKVERPSYMTGSIETALPFVQPGSQVRVVSGSASFESDRHIAIQAKAGDSFRYTA